MLVSFEVKNYKSIKDAIHINFEATGLSEHQDTNLIDAGKNKLLKSVLLYGPNASGKSKILEAFIIFRELILQSASFNSTRKLEGIVPFRLNPETAKAASKFEAEFIVSKKKYRYGFEANEEHILKEWLLEVKTTKQYPLFLRIGTEFEIDHKRFPNAQGLKSRNKPNALFLSVADQWNAPIAKEIYRWFNEIFVVHGLLDKQYGKLTGDMLQNERHKHLINDIIKQADLGIKSVELFRLSEEEKKERVKDLPDTIQERTINALQDTIVTLHEVLDNNGNPIGLEPFFLDSDESEGTKKFYNLLGTIISAVENGQLVIVDELDARFHSLMTKALLRLFNSETVMTGAQLLAVSHDVSVVDKNLLRRDQVYIVEKDKLSATKIINLAEFKMVRKDTPFSKNYLEGKYGGIPFIENLENVLKDVKE